MGELEQRNCEYLLECFKTAREELQDRIRYRDRWLGYQLLAMIALIAIATGGKFVVEFPHNLKALLLGLPITLAISFRYFNENYLIGYIASYIASTSEALQEITNSDYSIANWDNRWHGINASKKGVLYNLRVGGLIL